MQRGGGNEQTITMDIPVVIVNILLFALGIALLVFSIGLTIVETLFSGNATGSSGIILFSYSLMGLVDKRVNNYERR